MNSGSCGEMTNLILSDVSKTACNCFLAPKIFYRGEELVVWEQSSKQCELVQHIHITKLTMMMRTMTMITMINKQYIYAPVKYLCTTYHKNVEDQKENLHDDVETVTEFSYLGDIIYSGGGRVAAVTSRTRLGLANFRECQDLLCGNKLPLKIK